MPLLVMIHGCQTTAQQQMEANLYNPLADQQGFVVVYPDTDPTENAQPGPLVRCWQFWNPADWQRGEGDPAAIAAITQNVIGGWNIDPQRVYVMGMSAGAFMSSDLAAEYPDLYAASGENAGSGYANGLCFFQSVLSRPVAQDAQLAFAQEGPRARVVPRIVIGGDIDSGIPPACADEALMQGLRTNNLVLSGTQTAPISLTPATVTQGQVPGGHSYTTSDYVDGHGCLVGQRILVHGMNHFWSGGSSDPALKGFTDPKGPSAAIASWDFFRRFTLANTADSCAAAPAKKRRRHGKHMRRKPRTSKRPAARAAEHLHDARTAIAARTTAAAATSYDGATLTAQTALAARTPGWRGEQLTISTPALSGPTNVQVFLPPGYDTQLKRRWPVLYYLHGAEGDDTRFNPWYGDLIRGLNAIVVAPSGGALGFYSDWYNGGAFGPPEWETYDIDQLIPLIDGTFRTIAKRQGRVLIGESMGGYGVMTYATQYPDLFAGSVSMSGFLDNNYGPAQTLLSVAPLAASNQLGAMYGPRSTQLVRWAGANPTYLAGNLDGVALRVTTADGTPNAGEGSPLEPGELADCVLESQVYKTTLDFEHQLEKLDVPSEWRDYGNGCHTIWNFRRQFTDALPMIERVFAHPPPAPQTFDYESIRPGFTIWGWQVTTDPKRAQEFLQLQNVSRGGLTVIGSGTTIVVTPPLFRGVRAVSVSGATAASSPETLTPDRSGRLHLTVDLGSPHHHQEYTSAADAAGENGAGYWTHRTIALHRIVQASR